MASVASGGTAARIAARIFFKVLRAGSGTPARYSSTFFGGRLPFAAAFFIGAIRKTTTQPFHVKNASLLADPTRDIETARSKGLARTPMSVQRSTHRR